jgi:hypothetical protein
MTARRHWQDRLAYISAFLLKPAASSGRRHQSATRAAAALDHSKHDDVYTQAMPEGKRAANSVVVRSVLPFESCLGVSASGGREWEPIASAELLSRCGVDLNHRPWVYEMQAAKPYQSRELQPARH